MRIRKAEAVEPHAGGDRTARHRKGRDVDGGILLLDELPECSQSVLDVLRQPLEQGAVTLCRATDGNTFPARFRIGDGIRLRSVACATDTSEHAGDGIRPLPKC